MKMREQKKAYKAAIKRLPVVLLVTALMSAVFFIAAAGLTSLAFARPPEVAGCPERSPENTGGICIREPGPPKTE